MGKARAKIPALIQALDGQFTDHHSYMCRHYLDQIDHLLAVIDGLNKRIEQSIAGHQKDLDNLDTITGIGQAAAQIVIAETGGDMATFRHRRPPGVLDRRLPGNE